MTSTQDLIERFTPELRGFGASLPDEFAAALGTLERRLTPEQLEAWADQGVKLAHHSLRSWEAAAEYFRASPEIAPRIDFDTLVEWGETAAELASSSALMSAAYVKATPALLDLLPAEDLTPLANLGERLCRGNWKSISLSSLFYSTSPALLGVLTLSALDEFVDVIDALTERSYELATACLETAAGVFGQLEADDREAFLRFARAVTRASWADTRLYFERGPRLLQAVESGQRADFLDLAARVTTEIGRQGYPLFAEAATSLAQMDPADHGDMIRFARRLATGSPTSAMEYLKSAPFVRSRLTPEQMERWSEAGRDILFIERNAEGAEAYFRLESTRAEDSLAALSARVELSSVGTTLRLYAKALTGEQIAVRSTEDLVDRGIGWVTESVATTEGTSIYLPPYVNAYEEQRANFIAYKVFTTHQTGRLEFGAFSYRYGEPGTYTGGTVLAREANTPPPSHLEASDAPQKLAAVTPMQRYFDLFADRTMIAGLFTVVEDTRIDQVVSREYSGIREALRRLQSYEANRRPDVRSMGLQAAFVENLLRASLGRPDTIMWPMPLQSLLGQGLAALRVIEQPGATVQDSAEVATALYDIMERIPNIVSDMLKDDWVAYDEDYLSINPMMPGGGGDGDMGPLVPSGEEVAFQNPPQPEFRGDFKPELVQLLMQLRLQQQGLQGDAVLSPMSAEQLKQLLENSVEITISEMAEGDLSSTLGLFLSNLEKEAGTPQTDQKTQQGEQDGSGGVEEEPGPMEDLPVEVTWKYYDEWDFRAGDYRPRWCRVGERLGEEGELDYYDDTLRKNHGLVMETRRQFEIMRPETFRKIKRLEDGEDVDIDAAIEFIVDKRAGTGPLGRIYWRRNKIERDVAVAFLLDMSASTDEEIEKQKPKYDQDDDFDDDPRKYFQWLAQRRAKQALEPPKRIVDLEKESAILIIEALEAIGDSYGIYGFSGYGRDNVEYYVIKDLDEELDDSVRRRVDKIEPIRSTRMGPAIRHTIWKLQEFEAKVKILILVSDGRPQDHGYGRDRTEKEYAVHDTHQALQEAKRAGITPFLITVDKEGHDYLKQMMDDVGYEVVDNIESLPRRLPSLYRSLAAE
ncbi:MAG: VWA domain-containing protein [Dehalococcoidia bacterium]|nr:VWA domain-containing protein [Dehalococcoidia bacterium]